MLIHSHLQIEMPLAKSLNCWTSWVKALNSASFHGAHYSWLSGITVPLFQVPPWVSKALVATGGSRHAHHGELPRIQRLQHAEQPP